MGAGAVCCVSSVGGSPIPSDGEWAIWTVAALLLATAFLRPAEPQDEGRGSRLAQRHALGAHPPVRAPGQKLASTSAAARSPEASAASADGAIR